MVAGNVRRSAAWLWVYNDRQYLEMKNDQENFTITDGDQITLSMLWWAWIILGMQSSHRRTRARIHLADNARTRGRFKDGPRFDDINVAGFNPCVEQQLEDAELVLSCRDIPSKA